MEAATGHVILAHQRPEIRDRAIREWQRDTKRDIPSDLEKHLAKIRRRGFEERESYQVGGVMNISFPILDDQGFAIAAISIPFLKRIMDQTTVEDARFHLRQASLDISKEIGGD
jgi:DNA-binding IclR family transcriptional regulator